MLQHDLEKLFEKVGGPFRLTVLVQKRLKELKAGAPKLVDLESKSLMDIVYQEILEEKIQLVSNNGQKEHDEVIFKSDKDTNNDALFEITSKDSQDVDR